MQSSDKRNDLHQTAARLEVARVVLVHCARMTREAEVLVVHPAAAEEEESVYQLHRCIIIIIIGVLRHAITA